MPGEQDALISAVAAANHNTVVVLNTASAVTVPGLNDVRSVLEMWYPGQQYGTALASLLFGDVSPSGKLPVTFPANDKQGPWAQGTAQYPGDGTNVTFSEGTQVGYRWYQANGQQPLFPFGYGLSYTSFAFSDLHIRRGDGGTEVTARVTNTGSRVGAEVAQLYLTDPAAAGDPPLQLKGFQRVTLAPGRTTTVRMTLDQRAFSIWNTGRHNWQVIRGSYGIALGNSSTNLPLHGSINLDGGGEH